MSQRPSGYDRQANDLYETPAWVTRALVSHIPRCVGEIWEPAKGNGAICNELISAGFAVHGTDIHMDCDFLTMTDTSCDAIVTNPPFNLAQKFIEHSLTLVPFVAMLLRVDYDSAKTRRHLFADCQYFAKKLVLTKRIVWFERKGAAPSYNHAWFIWDKTHSGPPTITYGP